MFSALCFKEYVVRYGWLERGKRRCIVLCSCFSFCKNLAEALADEETVDPEKIKQRSMPGA